MMGKQEVNGGLNLTPKGMENYAKLLKFLSDPDNDWPTRKEYSEFILGYKKNDTVYRTLTPQVITEIENEALENRKARSARQRGVIRHALFKRAVGYDCKDTKFATYEGQITDSREYTKHYPPDPVAAREFLDRTEGKVTEKHEIKHEFEDLSDEELDAQIAALMSEDDDLTKTVMALAEGNGDK